MLTYYYDPMGASKKDIRTLDLSLTLLENLERHFPNGLDAETHRFILNGQEINPFEYDLNRPATTFDTIDIIKRQQGLGEGAIAIISMIVAIAAAAAAILLTPRPNIPNDAGTTKDSPNNRLTGQTNIARLYQAKPDIYGRCRVYPDLVGAAIPEYINHVKMVTQMMCVGMGNYDVHSVRYADNALSQIPHSSYEIFNPNDVIAEDLLALPSPEVDGQELTRERNNGIQDEFNFLLIGSENKNKWIQLMKIWWYPNYDTFKIRLNSSTAKLLKILTPTPITLQFSFCFRRNKKDPRWLTIRTHNANAQLLSMSESNGFLLLNIAHMTELQQSGDYRVEHGATPPDTIKIQTHEFKGAGPFILDKVTDEIWFNLTFHRGLKSAVDIAVNLYKLDSSGNKINSTDERLSYRYADNTLETRYYTEKIKPKHGAGRYAVVFQRISPPTDDAHPSNVKLEWLAAIQVRKNEVAKDTLIRVRQKATEHATSHKESKINLDVTRKTITYDAKTGKIDYNLKPSRSFADAILHSWVVMAGKPPERLNLDELYSIAERLPKKELGYFDFSFDDKDISLGQRVQTICNAARVAVSKDGLQYRFIRNQRIEVPRYQFDGRNLAKNGGTMSYKFSEPSSFDGVELEYVDAKVDNPEKGTDKKAFIRLKINRETGAITEGECRRPYKVQLAGCRNKVQAMNRAQLEARILLYNRLAVDDVALSDAAYLPIGSRVRYVDTYDSAVVSGEIMAINNGIFTTNTEIVLDNTKQYKVCITDEVGKPSPWMPFNQVDKKSFRADYKQAFTANGDDIQCGSRFIIACEKSEKLDFILTDKKPSGNNVGISLSVYDDRVYEYDDRTLPFKQWSKQH